MSSIPTQMRIKNLLKENDYFWIEQGQFVIFPL